MRKNYAEWTPEARYAELEELAQLVYGPTWKGKLAEEYGVRKSTVSDWRNNGAPLYIVVALSNAVKAKQLDDLAQLVRAML